MRKAWRCLRCGIDVTEYRGVCLDCQSFIRAHREQHLWNEPKEQRRAHMRMLNDIGVVRNPIKAKREGRYA